MKVNTSITKIKSEFSLHNATSNGGIKIFMDYLEKIEFPQALQDLKCNKHWNAIFPVHGILLYLILAWTLDCKRLFHFRNRRLLGGRCLITRSSIRSRGTGD